MEKIIIIEKIKKYQKCPALFNSNLWETENI